jgi:hypothetical protein
MHTSSPNQYVLVVEKHEGLMLEMGDNNNKEHLSTRNQPAKVYQKNSKHSPALSLLDPMFQFHPGTFLASAK